MRNKKIINRNYLPPPSAKYANNRAVKNKQSLFWGKKISLNNKIVCKMQFSQTTVPKPKWFTIQHPHIWCWWPVEGDGGESTLLWLSSMLPTHQGCWESIDTEQAVVGSSFHGDNISWGVLSLFWSLPDLRWVFFILMLVLDHAEHNVIKEWQVYCGHLKGRLHIYLISFQFWKVTVTLRETTALLPNQICVVQMDQTPRIALSWSEVKHMEGSWA